MALSSQAVLGEALAVMRTLPDGCMDHCIADPPYNMSKKKGLTWAFSKHVTMQERWDRFSQDDYLNFSHQWLSEVCRLVKPNGNIFVFGTFHNIYTLGFILQQLDRRILNSIIWAKPNAQPNITCRTLTESTEQIIWAANESSKKATKWIFRYKDAKKANGGKQLRNFWSLPVTRKSERVAGHPSQKPEELMERLVLLFSHKGQILLDPFAGTGTTGVLALRHGRRCFLIEKKAPYFNALKARITHEGLSDRLKFSAPSKKRSGRSTTKRRPSPIDEPLESTLN